MDNTARVWDARTGQALGPALQHQGAVLGAHFSRGESSVLTWSSDKTARVRPLAVDLDFPSKHVKLWLQAVTASEFDLVSRQFKLLSRERSLQARQLYEKVAADHAKRCAYPEFNQWILQRNHAPNR